MKKAFLRASALLCVLALLCSLTACGEQTVGEPQQDENKDGFVLRVCQPAVLSTLDPAACSGAGEETVILSLFENLFRLRDDGTGKAVPVPGMAKEYKVEKNYDDTVTYTFTLRSSARWSDGEKVTSRDFVYAWQRLADPATQSPNSGLLNMVAGYDEVQETGDVKALKVSASGDKEFVVVLSSPCSYFLDSVCTAAASVPLRRNLVVGNDNWAMSANIVTNGPYRVGTWTAGESLQTKRNTEYYEAKMVGPNAIRFLFTESDKQAYDIYCSGETDYVPSLPGSVLEEMSEADELQTVPLTQTSCVLYNHLTDTFSNADIRRAFDLALDRAELPGKISAAAAPASGFVPFGISNAPESEADFRTVGGTLCVTQSEETVGRRKEAEKALTQSGHFNGVGLPTLHLLYLADDTQKKTANELLRTWSSVLNVDVLPKMAETEEEFSQLLSGGKFDLALLTLRARCDDAMDFLSRWRDGCDENVIGYFNEAYDLLLGVADSTNDMDARAAFLHDAEVLLLEDYALSPICFYETADLLADGFTGVCRDCFGHACFTGVMREEE